MKIGFLGLGIMGRPMALNLLKGGHELVVWARRAESMAPLAEAGAQSGRSPADVAGRVELVISMVADAPDVAAVMLGDDGVAAGAAPGLAAADMSTIAPAAAKDIAARMREAGIDFLDAPVSGGEVGAVAGTLSIMAGGRVAAFEKARPAFACMGKNVVHVGDSGAGQVAKACNQMVMVAAIEAAAEAMRLAAAAGVDPEKVRLALAGGSAGSRVLEVFGARMTQRDFAAGVEARLHHKDFGILLAEAHALGLPLPLAAVVGQQLNALMAQGWGGGDTASLLRVLERAGPT